jgi:hypothetical protein
MTMGLRTVVYLHVVLPKHGGELSSTVDRARYLTSETTSIEVKAFVPARDFSQSEQFYQATFRTAPGEAMKTTAFCSSLADME